MKRKLIHLTGDNGQECTRVPTAFLHDLRFSAAARGLMLTVLSNTDEETGVFSMEEVRREAGHDPDYASSLRELSASGLIAQRGDQWAVDEKFWNEFWGCESDE